MCRLAAYLGPNITLSEFLLEPEHSLVKQSWAPKEMLEGTINADGFGFTWLTENKERCTYKNVLPIWSDSNLNGLGPSLSSSLWLAYVRGATAGQGINEANTQPFTNDNLIFTHNGRLNPFDKKVKASLLDTLSNEIRTEINGDSDSIYLFALLQQHMLSESNLTDAILSMMQALKSICNEEVIALLNFIISDGEKLYACRHALNKSCPSLYYSLNKNSVKVASEPLSDEANWIALPEHSVLVFNQSSLVEQHNL